MKERGYTLIEIILVASMAGAIVLFATGASDSITSAAGYGSRKLQVEAECQSVLHFIANDLQNSSTDTDPATLLPRFEIVQDAQVTELVDRTAVTVAETAVIDERTVVGEESLEHRPRVNVVTHNSIFRFQKVYDLNVDPVKGEVTPVWSPPMTYAVKGRNLVRTSGGKDRVVGTNVTAFKVVAEDQGNIKVFLRIQRRDPTTGDVLTASGMIEVNPKNR